MRAGHVEELAGQQEKELGKRERRKKKEREKDYWAWAWANKKRNEMKEKKRWAFGGKKRKLFYINVVADSKNSLGSSHVSRHTKSITNGDQARHIKCHIQSGGEDLRLYPTSYLANFGSRPEFTLNPGEMTSYFSVVISPRSKRVPIPVGAITDGDGYLSTPIPIIKHSNPSSYRRTQQEDHADMRFPRSAPSITFLRDIFSPRNPRREED